MATRATSRPAMTSRVGGVTFLFCDMVGSTALLAQLGEAANDEVRRDLFDALRQPIEAYHGREVKSQGDGLMVAFRTSAQDAVGCAVAMHQAVVRLSAAEGCPRLAIRAGISCGEVTSEAGDWFGSPVVEAARLCGLAAPGQILITDHAINPDAGVRPGSVRSVGQLTLKGFPETIPCSEVPWVPPISNIALPPTPTGLDLTAQPHAVGIEAMLHRAMGAWREVVDGATRALLVTGPPRVGRTRFVAELARQVQADQAYLLYITTLQASTDATSAIAHAFRRLAMWGPSHLAQLLDEVDGLRSLVPSLALRLDGRVATPADAVDRDRVTVYADALRRLSVDRPVVVVVEDVQRAGPDIVEQLIALIELVDGERVWFIITYRDAGDAPTPAASALQQFLVRRAAQHIELGPLSDDDVLNLALSIGNGSARANLLTRGITDVVGGAAGDVIDGFNRVRLAPQTTDENELRTLLSSCLPYKGLLALDQHDRGMFFGRDELVARVIDRLEALDFVAVVGASGSGKSSLLRAGVASGVSASGGTVIVGTPSDREFIRTVMSGETSCSTVIIDQFEEFFTLWDESDRKIAFEALLSALNLGPIESVAIGIRGDFFGHCAENPALAARLGEATVLVGPLSEHELRSMIEGPAEVSGLILDPGLADVIVSDLGDERHPLPLLSHTLFEAWRRRATTTRLERDDYHEAGGIRGSIARTAERVFTSQLDESRQRVARQLLLRLVEPGDDHRVPTRRPMPRSDIGETFGPAGEEVLEVFVRARLLVADEGIVEVAHEAVLSEWPRLANWIVQDREQLTTATHLARSAADWGARDRPQSELYRGARLDAARSLTDAGRLLTPIERDFVAAGIELRDRERVALRRTNRRLRRQLAAASVAAVLALGATVVAVAQRQTASRQRRGAELALLASTAADLGTSRGDLASLLAVEVNRLQPTAGSLGALETVLRSQPAVVRNIYPSFLSGAATLLATTADAGRAAFWANGALAIVDTASLEPLVTIAVDDPQEVAFSPSGEQIAVSGSDHITVFSAEDGSFTSTIQLASTESLSAGRMAWIDEGQLFITPIDGHSRTIDKMTGEPEREWHYDPTGLAVVNPSTNTFADIGASTSFIPWSSITEHTRSGDVAVKVSELAAVGAILGTRGAVLNASYSPDGRWLALGTDHGVAILKRGVDGLSLDAVSLPAQAPISTTAIFSADGNKLATFSVAGRVTLYEVSRADGVTEILHSDVAGSSRAGFFSPSRKSLFVVAGDRLVELSLDDRQPLATAVFGDDQDAPLTISTNGDKALVYGKSGLVAYDLPTGSTTPDEDGALSERWPQFYSLDDSTRLSWDMTDQSMVVEDRAGRIKKKSTWSFDLEGFVAFNQSGTVMAFTDRRGARLELFDVATLEPITTPVELGPVASPNLAISDDATSIARSYRAETDNSLIIEVIDLKTAKPRLANVRLPADQPDLTALTFAPDGDRLAFGDDRGAIGELDLTTGRVSQHAYEGATGSVLALVYAEDGEHLLAILGSVAAMWWDTASRDTVGAPITGSPGSVDVSVSDSFFTWAAMELSTRYLLTAVDGGVRRWNFDFATWPAIACERAGRNLTREEWAQYLPAGEPYHVTCSQFPAG